MYSAIASIPSNKLGNAYLQYNFNNSFFIYKFTAARDGMYTFTAIISKNTSNNQDTFVVKLDITETGSTFNQLSNFDTWTDRSSQAMSAGQSFELYY